MKLDEAPLAGGQVVYIRRCNALLVFFDLISSNGVRFELCMRDVPRVVKQLKLGDLIEVHSGSWDDAKETLTTNEMPVLVHKYDSSKKSFIPIPGRRMHGEQSDSIHCRYWLSTTRCPKMNCRFIHADLNSDEFKSAVQERLRVLETKRSMATDPSDPFDGNKSRKKHRAVLFASFLKEYFNLNESSIVLDVAGGAGKVSNALLDLGIGKVIVIDPRPVNVPIREGLVMNASWFDSDFVVETNEKIDLIVGMVRIVQIVFQNSKEIQISSRNSILIKRPMQSGSGRGVMTAFLGPSFLVAFFLNYFRIVASRLLCRKMLTLMSGW